MNYELHIFNSLLENLENISGFVSVLNLSKKEKYFFLSPEKLVRNKQLKFKVKLRHGNSKNTKKKLNRPTSEILGQSPEALKMKANSNFGFISCL